jgi:hypothetical protein
MEVLGHVKDDVALLADMISYLEGWRKRGIQTDFGGNHTEVVGRG